MKSISVFGTSSDAGKSTLTFVLAKLLQNRGYRTAAFKAQNVSNNARVADDGSEIAVAQYFQAEVLGIPTSYHLNPILLKSGKGEKASVIVNGKILDEQDVHAYYRNIDLLKPAVDAALEYLMERYDCVVCEGAGSPVELNLMDKDLSNLYVAERFRTKIVLVADIERGGVFASIWGVYNLLPEHLRPNVIGVIINKFRGDMSLFDEGVRIIEERFGIPVFGVLPYMSFNLGFEDSASLMHYTQTQPDAKITLGVIAYPAMSNYNDIEPLIADPEINVEFIRGNVPLEPYDLIILPGSKQTLNDLSWLKRNGLFERLQKRSQAVYGICGGYQMMFETLRDPHAVEASAPAQETGFGWIHGDIVFEPDKRLTRGRYTLFGESIEGFEMRHGISQEGIDSYVSGNLCGSFVHGVFENDSFRTRYFKTLCPEYIGFDFPEHKRDVIETFVHECGKHLNVEEIIRHVV
ncbi:MAG: cobyric acid synthase [Sulfuricurvum sp.]